MMPEELKPCPFCGCEKIILNENAAPFGWKHRNVYQCYECGCVCPTRAETKENAAKIWNTRAPSPPASTDPGTPSLNEQAEPLLDKAWNPPYKIFADHRTSCAFLVYNSNENFFQDESVEAMDATAKFIEDACNHVPDIRNKTIDEVLVELRKHNIDAATYIAIERMKK